MLNPFAGRQDKTTEVRVSFVGSTGPNGMHAVAGTRVGDGRARTIVFFAERKEALLLAKAVDTDDTFDIDSRAWAFVLPVEAA